MSTLVTAITAATLIVSGSSNTPVTADTPAPTWLGGVFQQGQSQMVPYPAGYIPGLQGVMPLGQSVPIGVTNTIAAQNAQQGHVTEMGTSQGALVLDAVMAQDAAAGVAKNKVNFVVIDDPQRGTGIMTYLKGIRIPFVNYTPTAVPVTPYNVDVVIKQYDGLANLPDNPRSPGFLLAVANAMAGAYYYHPSSVNSDLSTVPKQNITVDVNKLGGKTTTYLVPTPTLPLVTALEHMGLPNQFGAQLNGVLQPIVNSAYSQKVSETLASKPAAKAAKPAKKADDKPAKPATAVKADKVDKHPAKAESASHSTHK